MGNTIFGIIILIIPLIIIFVFVNPFLRVRGFALWFRVIVGFIAFVIIRFIVGLAIGCIMFGESISPAGFFHLLGQAIKF